eukprot:Lankesteria_metandrocarpae@DN8970_c0_g1_i1.p1
MERRPLPALPRHPDTALRGRVLPLVSLIAQDSFQRVVIDHLTPPRTVNIDTHSHSSITTDGIWDVAPPLTPCVAGGPTTDNWDNDIVSTAKHVLAHQHEQHSAAAYNGTGPHRRCGGEGVSGQCCYVLSTLEQFCADLQYYHCTLPVAVQYR